MTSSTSANTGATTSLTGSLFSQLRQLAAQLESGIGSLQTAQSSSRLRDGNSEENAKAISFLLHTKKDLVDLRDEVSACHVEFSQENTKIDRVSELMRQILSLQSERLERVESHFQIYGYRKPVSTSQTIGEKDVIVASDSRDRSCDANNVESEGSDDEVIGEQTNDVEDASPNTPVCQASCENRMRTPKLDDLYSRLSVETLALIKRGVKSTLPSEVPQNPNTTLKAYSNNTSVMKTPEPPVLLSGMFTLNNSSSQFSSLKSHNSNSTTPGMNVSHFSSRDVSVAGGSDRQVADTSVCQGNVPVQTPEMPTLLMSKFHYSTVVSAVPTKTEESARSFFQTPPMPELKTLSFRRMADCFSAVNQKSAYISHTAALSTPEAPKLTSVASMLTPEAPKLYSGMGLSTPEAPKLLTHGHNFHHYLENK